MRLSSMKTLDLVVSRENVVNALNLLVKPKSWQKTPS